MRLLQLFLATKPQSTTGQQVWPKVIQNITVDFDSLRIRAGDGDRGVFPYRMTVRDTDDLDIDAVAASSDRVAFSADGRLRVNAAIDTVSDVSLTGGSSLQLNAPIISERGQIELESTAVAVSSPITVSDRRPDARRPNDVIVEATNGDLALDANISAKNGVRLVQKDAVQGAARFFTAEGVDGKTGTDGKTTGGLKISQFAQTVPIEVDERFNYDEIQIVIDVNIDNTYGLTAYIVSPLGNRYLLVNNEGFFGDSNFRNTVFSSEANVSIRSGSAPYTGVFAPESSLAPILFNQASFGTWGLEVRDYLGQDATLTAAEIRFIETDPFPGSVSGVGLISAGSVSISADGNIGDPSLPVGAAGYFLNVDVENVEITGQGAVSVNALNRFKTTSPVSR